VLSLIGTSTSILVHPSSLTRSFCRVCRKMKLLIWIPKSTLTRLFQEFFTLMVLFCVSCGQMTGEKESGREVLSPSQKFGSFFSNQKTTARCRLVGKKGCAEINANGTAVGGQFTFQELFAECARKDSGWNLSIRNALNADHSSFRLSVTLHGLDKPLQQHVCIGPEYVENLNSGGRELKRGYCEVNLSNHNFSIGSSKRTPCLLTTRETATYVSGTITCPMLDRGTSFIMIGGDSRFDCPKI
jgi:hypothetical protein